MAFTYDPAQTTYTSLNLTRLLIGDTDSTNPLCTDAELQGIMSKFGWVAAGVNPEVPPDYFAVLSWTLRSLSVDPDRLIAMSRATSGGVGLTELMDHLGGRAETILA